MIDLKSALLAPRTRSQLSTKLDREISEGPNIQGCGAGDPLISVAFHAYFDVTLYVAVTLLPLQFLGRFATFKNWPLTNVGALPGCGGAIVVTSAFAKGRLSFWQQRWAMLPS